MYACICICICVYTENCTKTCRQFYIMWKAERTNLKCQNLWSTEEQKECVAFCYKCARFQSWNGDGGCSGGTVDGSDDGVQTHHLNDCNIDFNEFRLHFISVTWWYVPSLSKKGRKKNIHNLLLFFIHALRNQKRHLTCNINDVLQYDSVVAIHRELIYHFVRRSAETRLIVDSKCKQMRFIQIINFRFLYTLYITQFHTVLYIKYDNSYDDLRVFSVSFVISTNYT